MGILKNCNLELLNDDIKLKLKIVLRKCQKCLCSFCISSRTSLTLQSSFSTSQFYDTTVSQLSPRVFLFSADVSLAPGWQGAMVYTQPITQAEVEAGEVVQGVYVCFKPGACRVAAFVFRASWINRRSTAAQWCFPHMYFSHTHLPPSLPQLQNRVGYANR